MLENILVQMWLYLGSFMRKFIEDWIMYYDLDRSGWVLFIFIKERKLTLINGLKIHD